MKTLPVKVQGEGYCTWLDTSGWTRACHPRNYCSLGGRAEEGGWFRKKEDVQHIAFPRGPPPQYYRYSRQLNFAVRMGSGDPA